jgi:hypothetical protein
MIKTFSQLKGSDLSLEELVTEPNAKWKPEFSKTVDAPMAWYF